MINYVNDEQAPSEDDRTEMEVGMQGVVYGVSSGGGTTRISRKTQTNDAAQEKERVSISFFFIDF